VPSDTTSYDRVPYSSLAFPQTHPDRLATMARIFGVSTPDIAACRVLDQVSSSDLVARGVS